MKLVAGFVPKPTAVAPVKPVPVTVTVVPPPTGPAVGLMAATVGVATYENTALDEAADVPAGVVTVTPTFPAPAGLTAEIIVGLRTLNVVAAAVPNATPVAPAKPAPVIVTSVPPVSGPAFGLIAEIDGV
jgi:hypothetical protein